MDLSEKEQQHLNQTIMFFKEIQDITKDISDLCKEELKILNDPILIVLQSGDLEKISQKIVMKFLLLNNFVEASEAMLKGIVGDEDE